MEDFFENKDIRQIEKFARDNHYPVLLRPSAIELYNVIKQENPSKILEIGTAIGYSGSIILLSCKGDLVTLEKDNNSIKIAQTNFEKLNLLNRVKIINCDAYDFLINCNEKFDFIFLDGPKGQYIKYYPYIKKILNKNGILFADNVLFRGLVKQDNCPRKYRSLVNHLKEFNKTLQCDKDFETELKEIGDGLLIARKIL